MALIGIESKRFEPFRPKQEPQLSEAYWRPVWGQFMRGYESMRDGLRDGSLIFTRLDAAQLVKHAFGLRTAVHADKAGSGKRPVLFYVYAEPVSWPDGRAIAANDLQAHRAEINRFAAGVAGDEVRFVPTSYKTLLDTWLNDRNESVRAHALALVERFSL